MKPFYVALSLSFCCLLVCCLLIRIAYATPKDDADDALEAAEATEALMDNQKYEADLKWDAADGSDGDGAEWVMDVSKGDCGAGCPNWIPGLSDEAEADDHMTDGDADYGQGEDKEGFGDLYIELGWDEYLANPPDYVKAKDWWELADTNFNAAYVKFGNAETDYVNAAEDYNAAQAHYFFFPHN